MRAQSHLSLRHVPDDLPDCNCGGGLCCPDDPLELVLQFFPTPVAGEGSLASIGIAGSPLPLGPAQDNGFGDVRVLGSPGCCGGAVWEGDSCGVSNRVPEGTEPIDVTEYLDLPDDGGGSEAATVCNPSWDMAIVAAPTPAGRALGGLVSNGAPPSLLPVSLGARQPYTFPAFDGVASNDAPPLPAPMAADGGLHACHTLVAAAPDDTLMAAGGGLQACRTLVVANPNDTLPIPAGALHACGPLVGVGVVSNNAPHIPTGALQALPLQAHAPASAWTTSASRTSSGSLTPTASETNSLAPVWQPLAWVYPRTRRRSPGKCRKRPWSLEFPLRVIPAAPPPDDPGDNSGNDDMKNNCFSAGGGGIRRRRRVPRQRNRQAQRVCSHCHSSDTPQWRAGPNGPGTLCNACGIRYAANKLLPEYRPSTAPSFQSGQHSNRHRKVVKIREEKVQQTVKAMSDDPVPVSPKSDEFMDVCTYISTGL